MKKSTEILLAIAWRECDEKDKSTEYMLQYMQDKAKVNLDCVLNFIEKHESWSDILPVDKYPYPKVPGKEENK